MNTEEKIEVFISSKCGGERLGFKKIVEDSNTDKSLIAEKSSKTNYDLVRRALQMSLENTGIIKTYVFEDDMASTSPAIDDFTYKLDRSDICLFLIDNFENEIPPGVLIEYERAQQNNKKSIFIFLNHPDHEKTVLQKRLEKEGGTHFFVINDIREFINQGFKSVVDDIVTTYQKYCRGYFDYDLGKTSSLEIKTESFPTETTYVDKQIFKNLGTTKNKIVSLVYHPQKEEVQTSELDKLCVNIFEILLGEKKFSDFELPLLRDELKNIQNPKLHEIVNQRWDVIKSIYEGNLDAALTIIEKIYNTYSDDSTVPEWIIIDILIDWRNLKSRYDQIRNVYDWSVQKKIDQLNSRIYFPLIDRFSTNINDDIWDRNFKILTGSNIFYNLENLFGYISNYLLTAIYYGSHTHITLTLKEIQKVLFDIVQKENTLAGKFQLIRVSILYGDESNFSKIMDKYGSSLSRSTTKEILELYQLAETKPLTYEKLAWKVILFRELGYYFSNEDYETISSEIFSLSHKWIDEEDTSITLIEKFLKALKLNVRRLPQENIVGFLSEILIKKYYRFFDSVFEILENIDFSKLPKEVMRQLLSQVNVALDEKDKKRDYRHVKQFLIRFRKNRDDFATEIDETVKKYYPDIYEKEYSLEIFEGERDVHIQRYINSIRARNKTQGKNGKYTVWGERPFITIRNIIEMDKLSVSRKLFVKLLEIILDTLRLETQTHSEKIDAIQLLVRLKRQELTYDYNWDDYYSDLKQYFEEIQKGRSGFGLFERDESLSLRLHIILLRYMFGENSLEELLETLSLLSNGEEYEIVSSLITLKDFLNLETNKISENSVQPILVQYISSFCFHENQNIRYRTVKALYTFIQSPYTNFVIDRLLKMMDDEDYNVRWAVLHQASLIEKQNEQTYNFIIQKAKIDNHHLVRRVVEG